MVARRIYNIAVRCLAAALTLYLIIFAVVTAGQREFLFMPAGEVVGPKSVGLGKAEVLHLETGDGEHLPAWYLAPRRHKPLILFFHGQGGSIATAGETLRNLTSNGNGLLAVEYRGYPGSSGIPSEAGLLADAEAAYGKALALGVPSNQIIAFGQSLGSGVAVALAARHPVGAVVLESPYTSVSDVAALRFWMFPVSLVMLDQFHSDQRVASIGAPLLVVHGTADTSIPFYLGEKLFSLAAEPKTFIAVRDAGHLPINEAMPQVLHWLERAVPPW